MTRHTRIPLREGLLFALALSLFACQVGEGNRDELKLLSNGPDLPEECDTCWEDFKDCFDAGQPIEVCEDQIIECVLACEAPPPPPECGHCSAGYEACTEAAGDGEANASDCAAGFESCLGVCASPDPPPPNDCAQCDADYLTCIGDSGDADGDGMTDEEGVPGEDGMTDEGLPGEDGSTDENDPMGSEAGACQEQLWQCQMQCEPQPEPDPECSCDADLQACLDGETNDMGEQDPGAEQCYQDHDACSQACYPDGDQPGEDGGADSTCSECMNMAAQCLVNQDGSLDSECVGDLGGCFDACGISDEMSCQLLYDYCYDVADQGTCDAILDSLAETCATDSGVSPDGELSSVCQLYQAACGGA